MKKLTKLQKQFLILLIINILTYNMLSIYSTIHIFIATFSIYCINILAYKKLNRKTKVLLAILIAGMGSGIYLYRFNDNGKVCFYLIGMFFYSYEKKFSIREKQNYNQMDKKEERFLKSEKINKMINETFRFYILAYLVLNFVEKVGNAAIDKPSELSFILEEYNLFLVSLSIPFGIFLIIQLVEFYLMFINHKRIIPEDVKILSWLIKRFHISYKSDQLILKDETILLGFEFLFCILGFFYELKWYLLGAVGMVLYFCLYIALNFKSIKKL